MTNDLRDLEAPQVAVSYRGREKRSTELKGRPEGRRDSPRKAPKTAFKSLRNIVRGKTCQSEEKLRKGRTAARTDSMVGKTTGPGSY